MSTVRPAAGTTAAATSSPRWGRARRKPRPGRRRGVPAGRPRPRGRDLLAAAVDHFLEAAGERRVAVGVEAALRRPVRNQPSRNAVALASGVVEVAGDDVRPRGSHTSPVTAGGDVSGVVEDGDLGAGAGRPIRACARRAAAGWSRSGAPPRSCRRPRARGTPKAARARQDGCGQCGRGRADEPQPVPGGEPRAPAREIAWWIVGTAEYQVGVGGGDPRPNRSAANRGRHDDVPPAWSGDSSRGDDAVDVEQRHDDQAGVVRGQREVRRCSTRSRRAGWRASAARAWAGWWSRRCAGRVPRRGAPLGPPEASGRAVMSRVGRSEAPSRGTRPGVRWPPRRPRRHGIGGRSGRVAPGRRRSRTRVPLAAVRGCAARPRRRWRPRGARRRSGAQGGGRWRRDRRVAGPRRRGRRRASR